MRRNPNNYGSVTKLSGNRSRPWIVKVTLHDVDGHGRQVPIGYAATEAEAKILLAQYNNNPWDVGRDYVTLTQLYDRWSQIKFPGMNPHSIHAMQAAFSHCSKYYGMPYRKMRSFHMQECIDECGHGYSTQRAIKNLFFHLDKFAFEMDIIDKMYSQLTTTERTPETTRKPFSPEEVNRLWDHVNDPWVDVVLIYIYTGFRLNELLQMKIDQVNMEELYFQNGIKTEAGKGRIVPIHERIQPLVTARYDPDAEYFITNHDRKVSSNQFYGHWEKIMAGLDMQHTPHDARHTFETELDNARGNRKCIDMLMGHKSKDVGNRVYNHKTIDQLRETVALLK